MKGPILRLSSIVTHLHSSFRPLNLLPLLYNEKVQYPLGSKVTFAILLLVEFIFLNVFISSKQSMSSLQTLIRYVK